MSTCLSQVQRKARATASKSASKKKTSLILKTNASSSDMPSKRLLLPVFVAVVPAVQKIL